MSISDRGNSVAKAAKVSVVSMVLTYLLRGTAALTGTSRGFIASFSVFEEQVANLLPQHLLESA
jgi:hypothetical protein